MKEVYSIYEAVGIFESRHTFFYTPYKDDTIGINPHDVCVKIDNIFQIK